MKYAIYITICKMFYFITFMNILATNDNESTINENPQQYKEQTLLEQVKDHNKTLIDIFPILDLIYGLCIQCTEKSYSSTSLLNIGKCKTIIYLNAATNRLVKLPEYIRFFEFMEDLNLEENELGTESFDIISLIFNLRVLNISYNPIKEVPKTISRLEKLIKLSFGGYHHIFIADEVYKLKLTTLKLYDIKLCQRTLKDKIKESELIYVMINKFLENRTLKNFELYDTDISEFNFDNKKYYIKRLTFCHCKISTLPDSFEKLKELEYLDLYNNQLTTVPLMLSKFESLKELILEGNPIESYENLSFHSLETLYIRFTRRSSIEISISNTSSPLKYIYISTDYYNDVSFDSSTIKGLKGLYQFGKSRLKLSEHVHVLKNTELLHLYKGSKLEIPEDEYENMLENLEFLRINAERYSDDDISIISKLSSIREMHFLMDENRGSIFIRNTFFALKNNKNLEYLILEGYFREYIMLYQDTICYLENIKKLRIIKYYIECINWFDVVTNLKSIWFENVRFYESKSNVNYCMKRNKIRVAYKNCTFDYEGYCL